MRLENNNLRSVQLLAICFVVATLAGCVEEQGIRTSNQLKQFIEKSSRIEIAFSSELGGKKATVSNKELLQSVANTIPLDLDRRSHCGSLATVNYAVVKIYPIEEDVAVLKITVVKNRLAWKQGSRSVSCIDGDFEEFYEKLASIVPSNDSID